MKRPVVCLPSNRLAWAEVTAMIARRGGAILLSGGERWIELGMLEDFSALWCRTRFEKILDYGTEDMLNRMSDGELNSIEET